jgi:hypothetical protein
MELVILELHAVLFRIAGRNIGLQFGFQYLSAITKNLIAHSIMLYGYPESNGSAAVSLSRQSDERTNKRFIQSFLANWDSNCATCFFSIVLESLQYGRNSGLSHAGVGSEKQKIWLQFRE